MSSDSFNKLWNRSFILLMLFEGIVQFSINIVSPVVSNFAIFLGASFAIAGFLAGLNALSSLVCRPFGALVLRRYPRKTLLLVSVIMFFVSSFLCVLTDNFVLLGIARVIQGVAYVVKSSLVISFAGAIVPREALGRGVGWVGLANIMSAALAPVFSSWLIGLIGYYLTFAISALLFICALVDLHFIKDPEIESQREEIAELKEKTHAEGLGKSLASELRPSSLLCKAALPLMVPGLLEAFLYGTVATMTLLVGQERGIPDASLFFLVYAVVVLAARPTASKLYDKYGFKKIYLPEAIITVLSIVVMLFAVNLPLLLLGSALFALGQGCIYPCMQSESIRYVKSNETAVAANTFYLGLDIGMTLGPFVGGFVMGLGGSDAMYLVNVAVAVLFLLSCVIYAHRLK